MATYTAGTSPISMFPLNPNDLKLWVLEDATAGVAAGYTIVSRSATQIVVNAPGGEVLTFTGSGFAASGPVSGSGYTLTGFSETAGGASVFSLTGLSVADASLGGFGDNTQNVWNALSGNDTITGSAGAVGDFMYGGNGNDTFVVNSVNDVVSGGSGTDTVQSAVSVTLDSSNVWGVENVTLTGSANVNAIGNTGDNVLIGNTGVNVLTGGFGNDLLNGGAGADTLIGGSDNDTYVVDNTGDVVTEGTGAGFDTVASSVSYTLGATLENLTLTGTAAINGTGNAQDNTIQGNAGANVLDGKGGADVMFGGLGNDTYVMDSELDYAAETSSGGGVDLIQTSAGGMYFIGANIENLTGTNPGGYDIWGNGLNNAIVTGAGNDMLRGGRGDDAMTGGAGDDTYIVSQSGDVVNEAAGGGNDTIVGGTVSLVAGANIENANLYGGANLNVTGNALDNYLNGNGGNNTLDGGAGEDFMVGGYGNDVYIVDNANDAIGEPNWSYGAYFGGGTDSVLSSVSFSLNDFNGYGLLENLTLTGSSAVYGGGNNRDNVLIGNALDNTLAGFGGDDTLDGGAGADFMYGGYGSDVYVVDNTGDVIVNEQHNGGNDTVMSALSYVLTDPDLENITLTGTGATNATGNAYGNTLIGNAGANVLDGRGGDDAMYGGAGNDTYVVNSSFDGVFETIAGAAGGVDLVQSSASLFLNDNIENLTLTGSGDNVAGGNDLNNVLTGNSGDNFLNGLGGNDTMIGGAGNDGYHVDQTGDVVTELAGGGIDWLYGGGISLTAFAEVENIFLYGGADLNATGNTLNNILLGNDGDNTLNGGAGADVMSGGYGADVFVVDNIDDVVADIPNGGGFGRDGYGDLVLSSVDFGLAGTGVDDLVLTGSTAIQGQGNHSDNTLIGNSAGNDLQGFYGDDFLDGGTGADTMRGGSGSDIYVVDNTGDVVNENVLDGGFDTVRSSVSFTLVNGVEELDLTGTAAINATGNGSGNWLIGNDGANVLDGSGGDDRMYGGRGSDTYIVGQPGDTVFEDLGGAPGGVDLVQSDVSFDMSDAGFVENLTLTGSNAVDARGNDLNNIITGNAAANDIDGGKGADTMTGGDGNDRYIVNNAGDAVIEAATTGAGTDGVRSFINYTLTANVENLELGYGAGNLNATGNTLANALIGNEGDNTLDGGASADYMVGGYGDDTFVVDNTGDVAVDHHNAYGGYGGGIDTVLSSVSFELSDPFGDDDIENLTLTGSANLNGIGNFLDNVLTGNAGVNTLAGYGGDDIYVVQNTGDVVLEYGGALNGIDTVMSSVTYTLASALGSGGVERLVLTGNANINGTGNVYGNEIFGNDGANVLNGGGGGADADFMAGGRGNDTFIVDDTGDITFENQNQGNDTVQSSVSFVLANNVENLTLTSAAVSGTGNGLNNVLTGNSGANVLDGLGGADRMTGGDGNDTYVVDNSFDRVTEAATTGSGTDLVQSTTSYTLGANVENLTLLGGGNNSARGNDGVNVLTGNSGRNSINGLAGADTMDGRGGDDAYFVDATGDVASEVSSGAGGIDTVYSTVSYTLDAANTIDNLTLQGTAVSGTGNDLDNVLTGNASNNTLTGGLGNDTLDCAGGADAMNGGGGNDIYKVNNSGDTVTDSSGLSDRIDSTISYTLGTDIEDLTLTGNANINGTGNTLNNMLTGNGGKNVLDGGAGVDTMYGGNGADTLIYDASDNYGGGGFSFHNGQQDIDTLRLTGTANLDLYGGTPVTLDGFERIDASIGGTANTITLYGGDILDLSDTNTLIITADNNDVVNVHGDNGSSMEFTGQQVVNGVVFDVYHDGWSGANLLVSENVDNNGHLNVF